MFLNILKKNIENFVSIYFWEYMTSVRAGNEITRICSGIARYSDEWSRLTNVLLMSY